MLTIQEPVGRQVVDDFWDGPAGLNLLIGNGIRVMPVAVGIGQLLVQRKALKPLVTRLGQANEGQPLVKGQVVAHVVPAAGDGRAHARKRRFQMLQVGGGGALSGQGHGGGFDDATQFMQVAHELARQWLFLRRIGTREQFEQALAQIARRADVIFQNADAADDPQVLFAEHQTAGRGRRGRDWVSPFGSNLYVSIAWTFPAWPPRLTALPLAMAVALARVGASGEIDTALARESVVGFALTNAGLMAGLTLDDVDARETDPAEWRARFAYVPQDAPIFSGDAAGNVRFGRTNASEDEVRAALQKAEAFSFLEPRGGLAAEAGSKGRQLSGGERQRVGIARAILKNPAILVLDEATSALDSATEQEVQGALDEAAKGRTTLMVAHRLSTVAGADEIIVLDAGKIVERGTHRELLDRGGLYADLWSRQSRAHDEADAAVKERVA